MIILIHNRRPFLWRRGDEFKDADNSSVCSDASEVEETDSVVKRTKKKLERSDNSWCREPTFPLQSQDQRKPEDEASCAGSY